MSGYLQVTTTTDSVETAQDLAGGAVQRRLAACAQVESPIDSTYWWQDEMQRETEHRIVFKTTNARYPALAKFLAEQHPYDEPEIVATEIIVGSTGYLGWIDRETRTR